MSLIIKIIIPAYNEEHSIGAVIKDIPKGLIQEIIVVDNDSTDQTIKIAKSHFATVLSQKKRGYGNACLKGLEYVKSQVIKPDIILFLDADYSDFPEEIPLLIDPILQKKADLVIGSRVLGNREKGSMTIPQIFGNMLATWLISIFYGVKFTDLGPFRSISYDKLLLLEMRDKTYGWTVEMQIKAVKKKFRCVEIPVSYRNRIGKSKISGTVQGTIMAGIKIISTILKNL